MTKVSGNTEIEFMNLLVHILLQWRMMIAWMCMGAILMGGYSYYNSVQTMEQNKLLYEQYQDSDAMHAKYQNELSLEQLNNVERVRQYDTMEEYFNQSILMKINPMEVSTARLLYWIGSESEVNGKNICTVYEKLIKGDFLQWLAKNTTVSVFPEYSELITINELRGETREEIVILNNEKGPILGIEIFHISEDKCKELASYLKEYLKYQTELHKDNLPQHELVCISDTYQLTFNSDLLNKQEIVLRNIASVRKEATAIKNSFSSVEREYYEYLSEGEKNIKIQQPTVSKKAVVLGAMVFVFLYILYLCVGYLLNAKIRIHDNLASIFSVSQLGTITKTLQNNHILGKVDAIILKLQNANKRILSKEEEVEWIISAIKMVAKKNDFSKVLCVGTAWTKETVEIVERMKNSLKNDEIILQPVQNVLYNQESMELLEGAKAAVLLESANITFYDEVWRELEILKRQEIECVGIAVVEA